MKKLKLKLGSEKMLSKDQMKTIKGGYSTLYLCYCEFGPEGLGGGPASNCNEALGWFVDTSQCAGGYAKCYAAFNDGDSCGN